MQIEILNSLTGDDKEEIDTSQAEGRAQAAKLVHELIRSGSAVFLEKKIGEQTYTYRVTDYNPDTNKLTIQARQSGRRLRHRGMRRARRTRAAKAVLSARIVRAATSVQRLDVR
jgi:hypothetical protein